MPRRVPRWSFLGAGFGGLSVATALNSTFDVKSAYFAAKHGIVGLAKVTALETAERSITCNAICLGYTPLVAAQIDGQAKAHNIPCEQVIRGVLLAQQPNKRCATVEEKGALTVFLASDSAASITGITPLLVAQLALGLAPSVGSRCRSTAAGPRIECRACQHASNRRSTTCRGIDRRSTPST
jgi:hypothetical protein